MTPASSKLTTPFFSATRARWILYSLAAIALVFVAALYVWLSREQAPTWYTDGMSNWVQDMGFGESSEDFTDPLTLVSVEHTNGDLVATFAYKNADTLHGMYLEGVMTPEGRFWPTSTLSASKSPNGPWRTVGRSPVRQGLVDKQVLQPSGLLFVSVDFNVYKALIEKFEYGRVTSSAGDSNTFEISLLHAPAKEQIKRRRAPADLK